MNLIRPSDHGPVVVEDGAAKATSAEVYKKVVPMGAWRTRERQR